MFQSVLRILGTSDSSWQNKVSHILDPRAYGHKCAELVFEDVIRTMGGAVIGAPPATSCYLFSVKMMSELSAITPYNVTLDWAIKGSNAAKVLRPLGEFVDGFSGYNA